MEAPEMQEIISQKYGMHVNLNKHLLYKGNIIPQL